MDKIAIAIFHGLGDCINATTLLHPLRLKYPSAHITWVTSERYAPIVANNPYVNDVRICYGDLYLERSQPLLLELRKEFGDGLIIAGPYFNHTAKDNTLLGSYKERIIQHAPGITTDFIPEMYLTQPEVDDGILWVTEKQLGKFVILEALFGSSQSFWNRDHTNYTLDAFNKHGYSVILAHRSDAALAEYNKLCKTICLDVDFHYIPAIYNKASAFIGVSSGISCLVHTQQCRNDIPHLEFVNGEHWCTRAYSHKNNKIISFRSNQVNSLIDQLILGSLRAS